MAAGASGRKKPLPRIVPRNEDVHQGAILFLPSKKHVEDRYGSVRTLRDAGPLIVRNSTGSQSFAIETPDKTTKAEDGAYLHPILVLSRPDESTIEFVTVSHQP